MTIIYAILALGILIFVHELGHFLVAKASKIKVLEFAIGMGPKLFSKQGKETRYSLRLFPIGGYIKMEGEDEDSTDEHAFNNRPLIFRILVVVAGAFMNLILGFLIFVIITVGIGNYYTTKVDTVLDGYPAQSAGILPGDKVKKLNDTSIHIYNDFRMEFATKQMDDVTVTVDRNGEEMKFALQPKQDEDGQKIGITFTYEKNPWQVIKNSFFESILMVKMIFVSFGMLFTGQVSMNEVSGPVGIVKEIGNAASFGIYGFLNIMALITINLGVFNLLPIPALDGGRLVFLLIEGVRGKPVSAQKEGMVHFIGLMVLLLIMILVTSNDIRKIFTAWFGG